MGTSWTTDHCRTLKTLITEQSITIGLSLPLVFPLIQCVYHRTNNCLANALGNVGSSPVETLYSIVHAQQNAIYFDGANGDVAVPSLWTAYWSSDVSLVWPSYLILPCANLAKLF